MEVQKTNQPQDEPSKGEVDSSEYSLETVYGKWRRTVENSPEGACLSWPKDPKLKQDPYEEYTLNRSQVDKIINRTMRFLEVVKSQYGLEDESTVMMIASPVPEWAIFNVAVPGSGLAIVTPEYGVPADRVQFQQKDSQTRIAVVETSARRNIATGNGAHADWSRAGAIHGVVTQVNGCKKIPRGRYFHRLQRIGLCRSVTC